MRATLTPDDLCDEFPGTTRGSWAQHRYKGTGPRFFKVGRSIFYRREDIDTWIEMNLLDRTDRKAS